MSQELNPKIKITRTLVKISKELGEIAFLEYSLKNVELLKTIKQELDTIYKEYVKRTNSKKRIKRQNATTTKN